MKDRRYEGKRRVKAKASLEFEAYVTAEEAIAKMTEQLLAEKEQRAQQKTLPPVWYIRNGIYEVRSRYVTASGYGVPCKFSVVAGGRGFLTIREEGGKSISNAAEEVVEVLLALNGFKRFFYYESDGGLWELCHDGKRFTAFQEASMYQGECG